MRVLITAVLVLAVVTAAVAAGGQSGTSPAALPTSSPVLHLWGPTPADERVAVTLVLRLPGANRLRASLAAIDDPRSPQFHRFIDPRSFGSRFGIPFRALKRLERSLLARGLVLTASYPQRTALGVNGTAAAVEHLFHVRLLSYADSTGHRSHAPDRSPVVPTDLGRLVSGVSGLDTRPRWRAWDVPGGSLTPQSVQTAYDIAPLRRLGVSGKGMTIAIISFSDYQPTDPAGFASRFEIVGPTPSVVSVRGGTSDFSHSDEANLDIDVVRAVAPGAKILVYEGGGSSSSYTDVINQIVKDRKAKIISTSWGQCEPMLPRAERLGDSEALAAARAAGISMFAATGDQGAYDCQNQKPADVRLSVDWPASSANVIAVGGTRLNLARDGSYRSESAWDDALSALGGGGGFSTVTSRPLWQSAPGVNAAHLRGRRAVPDVSADADPGTGWLIYLDGGFRPGAGGTSAAAPFWAASMLLVSQYARRHNAGQLGYVNPMLYALASRRQRFRPLRDVTFGGNRYYRATRGWDPATGLGSPDVYNLARDVVSYLRSHPPRRR